MSAPTKSPGGELHELAHRRAGAGSVKPLLLRTALEAAAQRGYQALRVTDITGPAKVTRHAFYAHFRDKRHCLCEALDPRLAAIERLAVSSEREPGEVPGPGVDLDPGAGSFSHGWNAEIVVAIDELLIEHFGSAEGTRARLVESLAAELEQLDALAGIRIGSIVKRARVPQGDFYRYFSGKRECFAVLYEERLVALIQAVQLQISGQDADRNHGREDLLLALGSELESDPARARLLAVGDGELPAASDVHMSGARRGAFAKALALLLPAADQAAEPLLIGALIEVVRNAVVAENLDGLASKLLQTARSTAPEPAVPDSAVAA